MQGDPDVVEMLNLLLTDELTAINQYVVHAEMCEDWGYGKLHASFRARSITEMEHAEKLIERILFLEGRPVVSKLNGLHIGATVPQQIENDHRAEIEAVGRYNDAIVLAGRAMDYATRELLVDILRQEDAHVDELEEMQDQLEQMGTQLFLATQK